MGPLSCRPSAGLSPRNWARARRHSPRCPLMLASEEGGPGRGAGPLMHDWGHSVGGHPVPEHTWGEAPGREALAPASFVWTGQAHHLRKCYWLDLQAFRFGVPGTARARAVFLLPTVGFFE